MIIVILLILLLITGLLLFLHAKKTAIALWIFAIILWPIVGTGLLASFLLKPLQDHYTYFSTPHWGKRNIIVVLGAQVVAPPGTTERPRTISYPRIQEAARLYFSCRKTKNECVIIASGGNSEYKGKSEATVYKEYLVKLGVRTADIIKEPHSENTHQNAEFTAAILETRKFDKLFLVTSGVHLKRAMLYFSHFGTNPVAMPADYIAISKSIFPSEHHFTITDSVVHEYLGIVAYYFYNIMDRIKSHTN